MSKKLKDSEMETLIIRILKKERRNFYGFL